MDPMRYFIRGDIIRCEMCLYYYQGCCEHPIVHGTSKTNACDHGETAAMRLERMSRAAERANH